MADLGAESSSSHRRTSREATVILTTNLPFSEWTQVIPTLALQGVLDRITDRAHIIETAPDSFRFRRTVRESRTKTRADRCPRCLRLSLRSSRSTAHIHPSTLSSELPQMGPELTAQVGQDYLPNPALLA